MANWSPGALAQSTVSQKQINNQNIHSYTMIFNRYLLFFCAGYLTLASAATSETESRKVRTGFKRLVQLLNKSFDGTCTTRVTGEGVTPITPTTYVDCTRPGGYATMTADGSTNPIPKTIELCEIGAENKKQCKSLELTGTVRVDLEKAYAFLHGLLTTRSLTQSKPLPYEWLVQLLNATYGGTCQARVVGTYSKEGHMEGPTTFFDCVRPGSEAVLAVKDNFPQSLEMCSFGDEMKETCKTVMLSGSPDEDKKKVESLFHSEKEMPSSEAGMGMSSDASSENGHIVGTDFDMLVELLNGAFHNRCSVRATGMRPSKPSTYVVCHHPGGYATLTSSGTTNPVPVHFSVCEQGVEMKGKCDSVDLSGDTTKDIPAVKKVLGIKN
jgi:hypothetical protein